MSDPIPELASRFAAGFPEQVSWRTVGREAEFPLVRPDGSAGDVAEVFEALRGPDHEETREGPLLVGLVGRDHSWVAEVGRGTIELVTAPTDDLNHLAALCERAMARLTRAAREVGQRVLGYGIQPVTLPTPALMTPKQRYRVLTEVLGAPWDWFMITAGDQVHVDVCRAEVMDVTNLCNLLAPVRLALCANSPVYGGRDQGVVSGRESQWRALGADPRRFGMPEEPTADLAAWIRQQAVFEFLGRPVDGSFQPATGRFDAWVSGRKPDEATWSGWLAHDHYAWISARPRTAIGTVEIRSVGQQPWTEHLVGAALGLGMVEAHAALASWLAEQLGPDRWDRMRRWHDAVAVEGLSAPEPIPGLIRHLLETCSDALHRRGRGEEQWLKPLYARLEQQRSPASDARDAMARGGVSALLDHVAIDAAPSRAHQR